MKVVSSESVSASSTCSNTKGRVPASRSLYPRPFSRMARSLIAAQTPSMSPSRRRRRSSAAATAGDTFEFFIAESSQDSLALDVLFDAILVLFGHRSFQQEDQQGIAVAFNRPALLALVIDVFL